MTANDWELSDHENPLSIAAALAAAHECGGRVGYLPSNGTDGEFFRERNCYLCVCNRLNEDFDPQWPTVDCTISDSAMIAYPGPGPVQWIDPPSEWNPEKRRFVGDPPFCSEFAPKPRPAT